MKHIGGQAVIEGVMMRSDDRIATAVRVPSGEIRVKADPYISLTKKHKLLGLPVIRGAVSFLEMLVVGIKALNFSADVAVAEIEKEEAAQKGVGSGNNVFLLFAIGLIVPFEYPKRCLDVQHRGRNYPGSVFYRLCLGHLQAG